MPNLLLLIAYTQIWYVPRSVGTPKRRYHEASVPRSYVPRSVGTPKRRYHEASVPTTKCRYHEVTYHETSYPEVSESRTYVDIGTWPNIGILFENKKSWYIIHLYKKYTNLLLFFGEDKVYYIRSS